MSKRVDSKTSFQNIFMTLQSFWASEGCVILQPYDIEVGAGTFHPATSLRSLGEASDVWKCAYVQPSRRPADGRYGMNPNRLQHYYQFQVLIKPSPENIQETYLNSLMSIGIDKRYHDIRFVEDDWESPTLGAWGLGWEVWCDGMEVSQFTYFQQVGGHDCNPIPVEITYGLERLAMYVQKVENVFDLDWDGVAKSDGGKTYRDIFYRNEAECSAYNFEHANIEKLRAHFLDAEIECNNLLNLGLASPAYDCCLRASHIFNILDARGAISVTERQAYIGRVRALAKGSADVWVAGITQYGDRAQKGHNA